MKTGLIVFPEEGSMTPGDLGLEAERRGFESIFFPEHSHLPLASTNWPGGPIIPDGYKRTMDQFVCMTAAAVATNTIMIGSGVCVVPQHHPAWLAKQVATLDVLSGGRVILGIGFGWNAAELADHGVAYSDRRDVTREVVEAMQQLWTEEVASYEGTHVSLSPSWAWPKPVQKPHPKIIIGAGAGPKLFAAVTGYADGWAPMNGRDGIDDHLDPLRDAFTAAGRDVETLDITVFNAPRDRDQLGEMAAMGVTRAVFGVGGASDDDIRHSMDHCAALM
jgi:probable F420-dependent oxidoreductase